MSTSALFDVGPRFSVNDGHDHDPAYPVAFCKSVAVRRCPSRAIDPSNFFHIIFDKLGSRIIRACKRTRILFVESLKGLTSLLTNVCRSSSVPRLSSAGPLGHRVSTVVFASALVSAATAFLLSIFHIFRSRSEPQVVRIDTRGVVTGVADTQLSRLLSCREEVSNAVGQVGMHLSVWVFPACHAIAFGCFPSIPHPATLGFDYPPPESGFLRLCQRLDRSVHRGQYV